jgi:hypothetical protein
VTMVPFNESIASSFGTAVISFDLASVAICPSTSLASLPQALTMCSADHAMAGIGKPAHEALKATAELFGIEAAKQTAERIVARQAVFQLEEAAQERLLGHRECRHMCRALTAAEDSAQGDNQHFVVVVQAGIASPRVLQPLPAGDKLIQGALPRCVSHADW